jgi:hypothetical protein
MRRVKRLGERSELSTTYNCSTEGKFAIIYQIRTRGILQQYIMALGMLPLSLTVI